MSKPLPPIDIARIALRSAERELDTAARWLGRAKRIDERDRARVALAKVRTLLLEVVE